MTVKKRCYFSQNKPIPVCLAFWLYINPFCWTKHQRLTWQDRIKSSYLILASEIKSVHVKSVNYIDIIRYKSWRVWWLTYCISKHPESKPSMVQHWWILFLQSLIHSIQGKDCSKPERIRTLIYETQWISS